MDIKKRILINNLGVSVIPVILAIIIFILVFMSMFEDSIEERLTSTVDDLKTEINSTTDRMRFYALTLTGIMVAQPGFEASISDFDAFQELFQVYSFYSIVASTMNYEQTQSTIIEVFLEDQLAWYRSFVYQTYVDSATSETQANIIWNYMKDPNFHQFFTMTFPTIVSNNLVLKNAAILFSNSINQKVGTIVVSFPIDRDYLSALNGIEANAIPFVLTTSNIVFSDSTFNDMNLFERVTNLNLDKDSDYALIDLGEAGSYYVASGDLYSRLEKVSNRMIQVKVADIGVFYNAEFINQQTTVFLRISLVILGALLALIFPLALFTAGKITRPILNLKDGVVQFQDKMSPIPGPEHIRDEIDLLGKAFSDMSEDLFQKQTEINRDFQQASMVQKAILSGPDDFKSIDKLEVSVIYEPMNKMVSGDYYNIHSLDRGKRSSDFKGGIASAFIVDATGHGTQAALSTMQIDVLYKESEQLKNPGKRLTELNRQILTEFKSKNYFTAFMAEIFENHIEYACAGHNDQYLIRHRTGEIVPLNAKGVMLGMTHFDKYQVNSQPFEKGDILIMLTDGVFEQFNEKDEEYGEDRLLKYLHRFIKSYLDKWTMYKLINNIYKQVEKYRNKQPVNDDFTLIAIRKK